MRIKEISNCDSREKLIIYFNTLKLTKTISENVFWSTYLNFCIFDTKYNTKQCLGPEHPLSFPPAAINVICDAHFTLAADAHLFACVKVSKQCKCYLYAFHEPSFAAIHTDYTRDKIHFKQNVLQLARDTGCQFHEPYSGHVYQHPYHTHTTKCYKIHNIWTFEYILVNTITMRYTGHDWPHFAMFLSRVTCLVTRGGLTLAWAGGRSPENLKLSVEEISGIVTQRFSPTNPGAWPVMCTWIFVMLYTFFPYPLNKPCVKWTTFTL